jgi:hypothetical protein
MSDGYLCDPPGSAYCPGSNFYSVCVRGVARPAPTKIIGLPAVGHCKVNTNCLFPVTLQITDANNNPVNREGVTINLTVQSGSGNLSGTISAVTNRAGRATIQNFRYDTLETATITTSNDASLTNASNMSLNVTAFDGGCLIENPGAFTSVNGGCMHDGSGLVFSRISDNAMTWGEAVWDSAYAGSPAPDAFDGTRTFDYDTSASYTGTDNSTVAYCHDLIQGGYQDWRLPTYYEAGLINKTYIGRNGLVVTTNGPYLWTGKFSLSGSGPQYLKFAFNLFTGTFEGGNGGVVSGGLNSNTQSVQNAICVRGP